MTDRHMGGQTDRQGDIYRASADFVWQGPNYVPEPSRITLE